jgi:hypothetical protein
MIGALLPALVPILGDALKRLFPDAEARQRAEAELNAALLARAGELEKAAADIIKTEAQSEHWLAACWRPLMMITFGILIVLRWLGWSAPGISEAEVLKLWDIVQLGLGGLPVLEPHRGAVSVARLPDVLPALPDAGQDDIDIFHLYDSRGPIATNTIRLGAVKFSQRIQEVWIKKISPGNPGLWVDIPIGWPTVTSC